MIGASLSLTAWAVGTWGFILSVFAIGVAGVSAVYTRRQANETRNQAQYAKTVADIERARRADELTDRQRREHQALGADVRMSIDVSRGKASVRNLGPAVATGVCLSQPADADQLLINPISNARMRPDEITTTSLAVSLGTEWPIRFVLSWSDGLGSHTDPVTFTV